MPGTVEVRTLPSSSRQVFHIPKLRQPPKIQHTRYSSSQQHFLLDSRYGNPTYLLIFPSVSHDFLCLPPSTLPDISRTTPRTLQNGLDSSQKSKRSTVHTLAGLQTQCCSTSTPLGRARRALRLTAQHHDLHEGDIQRACSHRITPQSGQTVL